jgi:hypothetical protein
MASLFAASTDVSASVIHNQTMHKSPDKELIQGYLHSHEELHHLVAHFETFDLFRRNVVLLHGNKLSWILDTLEHHVVVWLDVHSEVAVLVGLTLCRNETKTLWKPIRMVNIRIIQCLWQMLKLLLYKLLELREPCNSKDIISIKTIVRCPLLNVSGCKYTI